MSSSALRSENEDEAAVPDISDGDVIAGELAALREENERLRKEYARARQSQYRQSAATLFGVGALVFGAGMVVESARTVLFALGGTGVFLGVLIYFLTPERFLSASVSEAVYASLAHNESQLTAELGLEAERVYVPRSTGSAESTGEVRLFVPQHASYEVPNNDELDDVFVVTDDGHRRGVSLRPIGAELYPEFQHAVAGDPSDDPANAASEFGDALVEQFELVETTDSDIDVADGWMSIGVYGSALGSIDRFDHPVVSFLGVGCASIVGRPITVSVTASEESGSEYIVTCTWSSDDSRTT
jgi:hypothetical protein